MKRTIPVPDLTDPAVSTESLQRAVGIMHCERMLYSRPPEVEVEIDRKIALIEAEIKRRDKDERS